MRFEPASEIKVTDRKEEHKQMRSAVHKYGSAAFSFDVFEVPEEYSWFSFTGSRGRGGIAYKKMLKANIIIGDPLLAEEDWLAGITAFIENCPRFTALAAAFSSRSFAQVALNTGGAALEAQTAVTLNPQIWKPEGPKTARIRQYTRKCQRAGMTVIELRDQNIEKSDLKYGVERLIKDWRENALKRQGNAHNINLWKEAALKQYFLLADGNEENKFHAIVVARPLAKKNGFYLWPARSSGCPTGALEAVIARAIEFFKEEGVKYLTFGPLQEVRPHKYLNDIGGTAVSRYVMNTLVPLEIKKRGYHHTVKFYKKFGFGEGEKIYNLLWPKNSWLRAYYSMGKWLCCNNVKRQRNIFDTIG